MREIRAMRDRTELCRLGLLTPMQRTDGAVGYRVSECFLWSRDAGQARPTAQSISNSPLTKSSHPEKNTSYGMTNEDWHTACGTTDRANRLRQRAVKGCTVCTPVPPLMKKERPTPRERRSGAPCRMERKTAPALSA